MNEYLWSLFGLFIIVEAILVYEIIQKQREFNRKIKIMFKIQRQHTAILKGFIEGAKNGING